MPIEKLIRKRASYKGRLTSFSNYLNSLDISSLDPTEINELQLRISRVEILYEQYDELQVSIECDVEDLNSQLAERNDFEILYYKVLSKAKQLLVNCRKPEPADSHEGSRSSGGRKLVKLPTIQLPRFSGSYENWLEFHDTFSSLIHVNDNIDDINKFHYLRASLEGSAAVVIQAIEFSSKNYKIAWQLLCDRFENKRLLTQNHVSALFNLEAVNKESSVCLKRLIDQTNKNLRALESLDEPVKYWDTLLIHIISHKLDSKTYREWEDFKSKVSKDQSINFELFFTFIRNRADLLETIEMSTNTLSKGSYSSSKPHINTKVKTFISVRDNSNVNNMYDSKRCPKCNGEHKLFNCSQFLALTNESRHELLPNYKICYNCFNFGHFANRCKKSGCKVCHRKHNTLVHISTSNYNGPNSRNSGSFDNINNTSRSNTPPPEPPSHSCAQQNTSLALSAYVTDASSSDHGDVLLSTALIKVLGTDNRQHIVRALLDNGSTSCLMSDSLFKRLGLHANNINNSVLGVNSASTDIKKKCNLQIQSLNGSYSTNINCFVLPSITDNVPNRPVNLSSVKFPPNICLADPQFDTPGPVDILIGANVFWEIFGTEKLSLGDGQPILCDTTLGWVVSGPYKSDYVSSKIKCNMLKLHSNFNNENIIQNREGYGKRYTTHLNDGLFCVRIPITHS